MKVKSKDRSMELCFWGRGTRRRRRRRRRGSTNCSWRSLSCSPAGGNIYKFPKVMSQYCHNRYNIINTSESSTHKCGISMQKNNCSLSELSLLSLWAGWRGGDWRREGEEEKGRSCSCCCQYSFCIVYILYCQYLFLLISVTTKISYKLLSKSQRLRKLFTTTIN